MTWNGHFLFHEITLFRTNRRRKRKNNLNWRKPLCIVFDSVFIEWKLDKLVGRIREFERNFQDSVRQWRRKNGQILFRFHADERRQSDHHSYFSDGFLRRMGRSFQLFDQSVDRVQSFKWKKNDWKSCKSYKKTLFSPSFPPLFSPSSNFHFSSDSDLYNSVHFKKNSLLQRVTASVSSFSNVVVGRFSDKSRADCSGNPFLGSSKNNSKSDTGRDLAKRRETEAFETAAPIDHTAAARLCTTTTLVLSPNSQE